MLAPGHVPAQCVSVTDTGLFSGLQADCSQVHSASGGVCSDCDAALKSIVILSISIPAENSHLVQTTAPGLGSQHGR